MITRESIPYSEGLERDILDTLSRSYFSGEVNHARAVRKWVLRLKPDAGYDLEIAALAHDIDRGVNNKEPSREDTANYTLYKQQHARRSANIIRGVLQHRRVEQSFVDNVEELVLLHEVGGTPDSDVLRDADSCSFFQDNLSQYYDHRGMEVTRKKIHFMYDRMSPETRQLVKVLTYQNQSLDALFKKETSGEQQEKDETL